MQCFWPHLARLALRRPAHSLTSSALGPSIRAQSTCLTTSIPFLRSPSIQCRAESTTAAMAHVPFPSSPPPPPSITRRDAQAGWKLCQIIQALVRKKELSDVLGDLAKLSMSSISSRRSSHVILHSLLRKGLISEASFYAQHSLNRGIKVHKRSLQAVVLNMVRIVQAQPPEQDTPIAPTVPLNAPTILELAPATNQNSDIIRSALALYEAERMSGKRRSHRLFKCLMVLCILNGEIILASLLFGTIMREWQARDMASRASGDVPSVQPAPHTLWTVDQVRQMCLFINDFLATDFTDPRSQVLQSMSLQALAQLAHMLDHGQLPYKDSSFLVKTMLLCPRSPARVWIPGNFPDDSPKHVNAYMYMHDVLERLIDNLPMRRRYAQEDRHINLTWLAGTDYAKLIEYTLKHRHSLKATRRVMQHILEEDPHILKIDELRNIVMHASAAFPPGVIRDLMAEFGLEAVGLDWDPNTSDFTYSTVIDAMTKAGDAGAVMDAIPALLPGLFLPPYDESLSIDQRRLLRMDLEEEGLRRGVTLGPFVFVCLMNAARSLGNTKFCERIFRFGLTAQERSWKGEPGLGVVGPWCLPVHAYTVMLHVYAREMNIQTDELADGWGHPKKGEEVSRAVMGRRMILATVRRMAKEARLLEGWVKEVKPGGKPSWLSIPYPDGFFFKALINAFARMPDDPIHAVLRAEMEAEGFRPPAAYLESLNIDPHLDEEEQRSWREPKDIRPFAFPEQDAFSETHAPVLYTKKLPRLLKLEAD